MFSKCIEIPEGRGIYPVVFEFPEFLREGIIERARFKRENHVKVMHGFYYSGPVVYIIVEG